MNKIAICYICIGKYSIFWEEFYKSFEERFCVESEKHYYVFTDAKDIIYSNAENVHIIYQKNLGWPYNTLNRYDMFLRIKEKLQVYQYILFFNSNSYCCQNISEEEFLPNDNDLVVVQHPAFYRTDNTRYTYDRNSESTAYIPVGIGKYYICGGINGGKADSFLQMAEEISRNVRVDCSKGIIALWHDESHINKYIIEKTNYRMLSPAYCYPEGIGGEFPFECKILIRHKMSYFDVNKEKRVKICTKWVNKVKYLLFWLKKDKRK